MGGRKDSEMARGYLVPGVIRPANPLPKKKRGIQECTFYEKKKVPEGKSETTPKDVERTCEEELTSRSQARGGRIREHWS